MFSVLVIFVLVTRGDLCSHGYVLKYRYVLPLLRHLIQLTFST